MGKIVEGVGKLFGFTPEPPADPSANRDINVLTNKTAPSSFLDVIYGSARTAGVRIHTVIKHFPNPENSNKLDAYLYAIYALSHGTIKDVTNPRMDDVPFTDAKLENFVDWDWGDGNPNQNAATNRLISELDASQWDLANGRLRGVAFAVVKLKGDKDEMNKLGNITFDVTGKIVYDPRTLSEEWSDNPSLCTLDYLTNPIYGRGLIRDSQTSVSSAIAAANYFDEITSVSDLNAVGNCKIPQRGKNAGYISTQKAVFDNVRAGQLYTVTGLQNAADSFTGVLISKEIYEAKEYPSWKDVEDVGQVSNGVTEFRLFFEEVKQISTVFDNYRTVTLAPIVKRYTCNGVVNCKQKIYDNLHELATSYNGYVSFDGAGKAIIIPDKVDPVIMHFDDDNIIGAIEMEVVNKDRRYNKITGQWIDPEHGYDQVTEVVENSIFKSRDNDQIQSTELNLPFTNNYYIANRLCTLELNKSRHAEPIKFSTHWDSLRCVTGNVITITRDTLAWNTRRFRIVHMGIPNIYGEVALTCIPYDSDDYIPGTINTRATREYLSLANLIDEPPVTDIAFAEVYGLPEYSGKLSWTAPADRDVLYYNVSIGTKDGQGVFTEDFRYTSITKDEFLIPDPLTAGTTYFARVMWVDQALRIIMSEAEISFTKAALAAPTGLVVTNKSPWAINAIATYDSGKEKQGLLTHKWYVAEYDGNTEPTFSENDLVFTGPELSYSGLDPEKEYRLWARCIDRFGESAVFPAGDGHAFTMVSGGAGTTFYYINYPNGTAIKNGQGTLTLEAHKIEGGTDSIITGTPQDPQLYDGNTALGYSADFDSADINGSKVIQLKDGSTVLDSVTLVDVADGVNGVVAAVSTSGPLSWNRAINYGAWTPSTNTVTLTFTFYDGGNTVAQHQVRITLNTSNGTMTAATFGTPTGDATTLSLTGNGTSSVGVSVIHTDSGARGFESVVAVQSGLNGVPGTPGADGTTYYTWVRYADTASGGGMSNNPTGKAYIGIAPNQTSPTESSNPAYYTWSLIKGTDGVPGTPGEDGITYYTWIAYSDNSNGNPMYQVPNANTKYIGIATNKLTATESTNPADYTWSQFKGDPGATGGDGPVGIPGDPGSDALVVTASGQYKQLIRGGEVTICQVTAPKAASFKCVFNGATSGQKMSGSTNPTVRIRAYRGSTLLSESGIITGDPFSGQWSYETTLSVSSGQVFYLKAYASWPTSTDVEGDSSGNLTLVEQL